MTSSAPRNMLPRSPAGNFLSGAIATPSTQHQLGAHSQEIQGPGLSGGGTSSSGGGQSDVMARSPSALSSVSSSSFPRPGLQRRRSTDTSGGLDYYWSSLAGVGASSSSSSLAVSPSPSSGLAVSASASPAPSVKGFDLRAAKSYGNIGGLYSQQQQTVSPTQIDFPPYPFPQQQQQQTSERTPRLPQMDGSGSPPSSHNNTTRQLNIPENPNRPSLRDDISPGGWSESSKYSTHDSSTAPNSAINNKFPSSRPYPFDRGNSSGSSSDSAYSPVDYRAQLPLGEMDLDTAAEELRRGLLDPSLQPSWEVRSSVNSASTTIPALNNAKFDNGELQESDESLHRTPMASAFQERPDIRPPQFDFSHKKQQLVSPSETGSDSAQATPNQLLEARSAGKGSYYTPTTAHQLNFAERPPSATSLTQDAPRSAPAWKSEFGELNKDDEDEEDDEDTLKGRNKRSTLPAISSTSSGAIVEAMLSPSQDELLSPDRYARAGTPTGEKGNARRTPSPNKSPEPPPRSTRRAQYVAPSMDPNISAASSPASFVQTLPVITHTPNSPMPSPDRSKAQPHRPDRSPDRQHQPTLSSPSFPSSASISDLTDMLGGAIDAIGLIDSRDTPPPTIAEPSKKEKPNMTIKVGSLQPAAELHDRGPITPTSLPMRGASLPGSSPLPNNSASSQAKAQSQPQSEPQVPVYTRRSTQPELVHKTSSLFSKDSSSQAHVQSPTTTMTTTTLSISARPWPAAMLYGNIKSMKHSGDRARGYARAINELARSESGLREWCAASAAQAHRPMGRPPARKGGAAALGVRANSVPSAIPLPHQQPSFYDPSPHPRNISSGSEFPMRADSYAAREISQRVIDPADQPTALPPNLPYPQLQAQLNYSYTGTGGGGLKPSQSMQSVSSFASSKKGFFSAIGRRGSGKKESLSLGPPGGIGYSATNKKDVRGLPISGPRSASPQYHNSLSVDGGPSPGASGSGSGHSSPGYQQSQASRGQSSISSAPMGPRGPRPSGGGAGGRSYTPPPPPNINHGDNATGRASLDTSLARMIPSSRTTRGSLDSARTVPPPMGGNRSGISGLGTEKIGMNTPTPREEEVRHMADILPHVERSVLRAYLRRYGDAMQAIGAYLEDEKNGTILR
ncbi:hypothetical protein IAR55_002228 [Kwoniella newhampshirensis]|uniref:CUE domain-containing protein n=1 Tax=Kwoniella newhampshirensis TaxID=1651941 RepID=A0AAW0Z0V6_9TREE